MIVLMQPAFKYADLLRVDKCLPLLGETVEDLNAAYVRSADAQDCIEHNTANVTFLEDQMATLQRKLLAKQTEKAVLDREIDQLEKTVELGIVLTPGLCIRQLEKSLLTHVLSFLNPAGGVNRVCKYWSQLAADVRQQVSNSPQKAAAPARVLHRTKSEVKTALAQIKSGIMLRELTRQQAAKMMAAVSAGDAAQLTGHSNHNSPSKAGSVAHGTVTPALSANSIAGHSHTTAVSSVGESTAAVTGGAAARKSPGASPAAASPKLHKAGEDVEVSDTSESDDSERDEKKAGAAGAAEFNHTTLHRTNSSKSNSGNVRVSFDNILPANTHAHNQSFTTKVSAVQATPTDKKKKGSGMAGGTANAISQKHLPQPPQEEAAREVTNFVNNLQWGRERPSNAGGAAQQGSPQGRSKREDRKTGGHHAAGVADTTEPTLPAVAESKKKSRVKLTSKSAQLPPPTGGSTAQSKKMGPSGLPDNENSRNLLLHVKKVRSEQQMNAMIEYLQAGFIKIETLTTEKRRIKKLIKAWNASFEKNNSRLPTSSERKGHLRELYEEYHQVRVRICLDYVFLAYFAALTISPDPVSCVPDFPLVRSW